MENRCKVLHYMTGMADIKAGIETYILNLYQNVDKDKLSFSVLTRNSKCGSAVYKEFQEKGIEIFDLECHKLGIKTMYSYYRKVRSFFKTHKGRFDVLHMHGFDDPFVAHMAKKSGIEKCLLHAHSVERENKGLAKNLFKNVTSNGNMRWADCFLACSDYAGQVMYKGRKFEVVKNAIPVELFEFQSSIREEMRIKLGVKDSEVAFCYTGRFIEVKNLPFLLDVFSEIVNVWNHAKLFLVGDGEQKEELISYVTEKNLQNKVVMIEQSNQVGRILQAMDVYMQTSISEGFSISALEAQCSGLPVFISDVFPQEIEVTGLVNKIGLSRSAKEWAQEIISKLEERKNLDISVRTAYSEVIRKKGYDIDNAVKEMCHRYLEKLHIDNYAGGKE